MFKLPRSCRLILKIMEPQELLTAQAIHARMRSLDPKSPGLSTTYRSLEILTNEGYLQTIDLGEGERLYEHVNKGEHHHHLFCNTCENRIHLDECAVQDLHETLVETYGFQVKLHRMEIFGNCEKCLMNKSKDG